MFFPLLSTKPFSLRASRCWTSCHPECWPLASKCGCSRETSPGLHVQPWPVMTILGCLTLANFPCESPKGMKKSRLSVCLSEPCLSAVAGYESLCQDQNDRSHKQLLDKTAARLKFQNWTPGSKMRTDAMERQSLRIKSLTNFAC